MRKFNFFSLERFSRVEKIDASSMSRVMWPRFSPGEIICIAQRQVWENFFGDFNGDEDEKVCENL